MQYALHIYTVTLLRIVSSTTVSELYFYLCAYFIFTWLSATLAAKLIIKLDLTWQCSDRYLTRVNSVINWTETHLDGYVVQLLQICCKLLLETDTWQFLPTAENTSVCFVLYTLTFWFCFAFTRLLSQGAADDNDPDIIASITIHSITKWNFSRQVLLAMSATEPQPNITTGQNSLNWQLMCIHGVDWTLCNRTTWAISECLRDAS